MQSGYGAQAYGQRDGFGGELLSRPISALSGLPRRDGWMHGAECGLEPR